MLVLVFITRLPSVCATLPPPWSQSNGDAVQTRQFPYHGPQSLQLQWSVLAHDGDEFYVSQQGGVVASADGLCFVCGVESVYAIVCSSGYGVILWSTTAFGGCEVSGVALAPFAGGAVLFPTAAGIVAFQQHTGSVLWMADVGFTDDEVADVLVDAFGVVYVTTSTRNQLIAIDAQSGTVAEQAKGGVQWAFHQRHGHNQLESHGIFGIVDDNAVLTDDVQVLLH